MDEKEFKKQLTELFNGGGTNGGLFIDGSDCDMLIEEILLLVNKLK